MPEGYVNPSTGLYIPPAGSSATAGDVAAARESVYAALGSFTNPFQAALSAAGLAVDPSEDRFTAPAATPPWVRQIFDPEFGTATQPRNEWYRGADRTLGSGDDRVFMGRMTAEDVPQDHIGIPGEDDPSGPAPEKQPDSVTVQQAMNMPYMWSDEKVQDTIVKMREAGFANVQTFDDMLSMWGSMVQRASMKFTMSKGKQLVTPWDVLDSMKKENVAAGVIDKDGNVVQTQTNKSVYEISDDDAWATLRSAMSQMLGRAPTDQEVRDFTSRANDLAQRDPTVTETTTRTDPITGETTSETSTDPGYDEGAMTQDAIEDLEDTPEYANVQAATTYSNAFFSAIGEMF